jgi:hypothetical protein
VLRVMRRPETSNRMVSWNIWHVSDLTARQS